jgi:predicted carbohydrate-binding protein with CBM5 and CBM33 domain
MRTHAAAVAALLASAALPLAAQTAKTHRLEATPSTIAYGYYWSEAKPALRIASGDIIDVDTLLTNSPMGLQRAGVPDAKIQSSLKAIVTEVTGSPGTIWAATSVTRWTRDCSECSAKEMRPSSSKTFCTCSGRGSGRVRVVLR